MPSPSDSEPNAPPDHLAEPVVAAAMDGDLSAFEQLVLHHQGGVRGYLAARLAQRAEAEDLARIDHHIRRRGAADR